MSTRTVSDHLVLGIVLVALGVLVLVGLLRIPFLTEILGVVLIVLGLLGLAKKKGTIASVVLVVLGVLLLLPGTIGDFLQAIIQIGAGGILLAAGILKLLRKW